VTQVRILETVIEQIGAVKVLAPQILPIEVDGAAEVSVREVGARQVGEGVENLACLHSLGEAGTDIAQGFFISEPLASDELHSFLDQRDATAWDLPTSL